MKKLLLLIFVLILVFIGWKVFAPKEDEYLKYALEFSGNNKSELIKTLDYYKDDLEKYEAACFLIRNMPKYYSYSDRSIDLLKSKLDGNKNIKDIPKKQLHLNTSSFTKIYDAHVITSDYLIKNINLAFEAWKKRSWNKELTFDEFCELILPYRIDNEPIEDWRELYQSRFSFLIDSVYQGSDVIEAVNVIAKYIREEGFEYNSDIKTSHFGPIFLIDNRIGTCRETCGLWLYIARALGIPSAIDFYSYSSETRQGHTWTVVRDTTGLYYGFDYTFKYVVRGNYSDGRRMGKAFRQCYGIQEDKKDIASDNSVHPFFKNMFIKDVTEYYFKNKLEVPFPGIKDKYGYLGTFAAGKPWVGVDIAEIKDGKAVFNNIEPETIYAPLVYDGEKYNMVSGPFYFDGEGVRKYIPDLKEEETVELFRKHIPFYWIHHKLNVMWNGKIEFSKSPDFKNIEYMYHIADTPRVDYNEIILPQPISSRYVRYTNKEDIWLEISEMGFSNENIKINPVSVHGLDTLGNFINLPELCDNDPLTYVHAPLHYIVIDFGENKNIDQFSYTAGTDDNFIRIGDTYELFYYDEKGKTVSLGRQVATENKLVYDVPKNALLYLHNKTRGVEEHCFEMKDGKQLFLSNMIEFPDE